MCSRTFTIVCDNSLSAGDDSRKQMLRYIAIYMEEVHLLVPLEESHVFSDRTN